MKIMDRQMESVVMARGSSDEPPTEMLTDETFFDPEMTYFYERVLEGRRRVRLQGMNGLLHYIAGTSAQSTDR